MSLTDTFLLSLNLYTFVGVTYLLSLQLRRYLRRRRYVSWLTEEKARIEREGMGDVVRPYKRNHSTLDKETSEEREWRVEKTWLDRHSPPTTTE